MAKTYLRTGRISWSPLTTAQQAMLANVNGIAIGSTFSATLDSPTETFLIGNGVISVPTTPVVASSGDTAGDVPVDNGDGTYSWAPPSGGSGSRNWAILTLATPSPLAVGSDTHYLRGLSDISIESQAGSDFSVSDSSATVLTAAGGRFMCTGYVGSPSDATLDAGSSKTRWLWFGVQVGSLDDVVNPLGSGGLDVMVPVVLSADGGDNVAVTCSSEMGYSNPGDPVLSNLGFRAMNLHGTDSIPLDNVGPYRFAVWQV